MKKGNLWLVILAITLVFTMMAVGCDNGGGNTSGNGDPQKVEFTGYDADGNMYSLILTEKTSRAAYQPVKGDSYELRITKAGVTDKVSKGTVSDVGTDGTLTLQPAKANSPSFRVKKNGQNITAIPDPITFDDVETVTAGDFEEGGEPSEPDATFTSIEEMAEWLSAQPENTAYTVALNVSDLGGSTDTEGSVGFVLLTNHSKCVNLDLSGSTITTIPEYAFVSVVGDHEYYVFNTLTGITIPNSVTSIGYGAFYHCTNLASVTFQGTISANYLGVIVNGTFFSSPFWGDLRDKYLAGGIGTYTTTAPVGENSVWTKQ